jgi:drug/metabolite transporter (DMT)-like permease
MISVLGIVFSVIAMVTMGLSVAMARIPSQNIGVKRFLFWRQATTSLLLFCGLLAFGRSLPFSIGYFTLALAIAFISYVALISAYQALKIGKIGVISPIANSSAIVTVLFSVIFLHESLIAPQIAMAFLAVLGIIILSINFSDFKSSDIFKPSSGVPLALVACLVWGIVYALYKIPVAVIGPLLTAFAIEFGSFLPNIPANIAAKTSFALPDAKTRVWILGIGLIAAASTLSYNLGIQVSGGNVALVAAITFSNPIISAIYGSFAYKEKLTPKQWVGLTLTVLGIMGISII